MSVLPSILQPAWAFSWNHTYKFFLNFGMVPETHLKLCVTKLDFLKKKFWSQSLWKRTKIWAKFEFIGKFIIFYWICSIMNLWNYVLCSCKNPVFEKIFIPEMWVKIFSVNQIAGFFINHISRTNQWNSLIFCTLM